MEMYSARMMAIHDLVEESFLCLPKDPNKSVLGMVVIIE